ncbi:MAG TPA: radical SAM protein [Planctomycetota bacterium]|nr:radical SAM protein [Planctomycetota bacterium]
MAQILQSTQKQVSRLVTALRIIVSSPVGIVRVTNAAMAKAQMRLRSSYCPAMPTSVAIEVTNLCSGDCVLCPVGQGRRSRSLGMIEWDNFTRLVDEVSPYVTFIGLYNWGEPLMHPRIYDMIEYVKARKIHAEVSSNLHNLETEDSERLVRSGLDVLGVALHGLSEETYRNYQPRHRFVDVINKVKAVCETKRRLGSQTPEIRLDYIVRSDNECEAPLLPDFAANLGVGHFLEETSLNLRLLPYDRTMKPRNVSEEQLRKERLELMDRWLPKDDAKVNPVYRMVRENGGIMPSGGQKIFQCTNPWHHMIICWDGDVDLCCGSYEKRYSVGNVFGASVREVWNNSRYRAARRSIRNKKQESDPWILCDVCPGMLL